MLNNSIARRARLDSVVNEDLSARNELAAELEKESWLELDTAKRLARAARLRQQADQLLAQVGNLRRDSEDQFSGGGSTYGMPNLTRGARLGVLRSHRNLHERAAGACIADWPSAGSWAGQAITEGRWIDGDPAQAARLDSADAVSEAWELGTVQYGGDSYVYEGRGDLVAVPFEEDGRRCRVISSGFAVATLCHDEEGDW